MILARNWWKRRGVVPLTVAVDAELPVLPFVAVDLESQTEHGTYYVGRVGSDWSARFRPVIAAADARDVALDARDCDGNCIDWPSRGSAERACRLHAHLVGEIGYSVLRAAELVAQRSQRPVSEERVETLEYGQPAGARP